MAMNQRDRLRQVKQYLAFVMFAILPFVTGCATLPENFVLLADRGAMTFEEVLPRVANQSVILIGEGHEREEDHLVQFEFIKRLHETGRTVAIALEMFPAEAQDILNQWVMGTISEDDFKKAYYRFWTAPYQYYSRIFEYARQTKIPLVGINGSEAQIKSVAKAGVGQLSQEFRKAIRFTTCAGAPEYERIIGLFEPSIAHMEKLPFFCDAQLLRDTLMAYNIADILERGRFTVVVLAGSTHTLKVAIPRILLTYYNVHSAVLMSKAFAELISREPDAGMADYIWY
jgi:aminopeptidase N